MTKPELFEYLEFKANLEREMARQLANWSPTEKPTPTNNMELKESFESNENYSTGTITNIYFHKSSTGSKNYVNTVYVQLDNEDQEKIYNVTFDPRCRAANWSKFYDPLNVPHVTKDSTIKQQKAAKLDSLVGKEVKVKMVNGKIERFVKDKEKIPGLEKQINELFWDSEIGG